MDDLNYCGNTIASLDDIINGHGCGTSISSIDQITSNPGCGTDIEDLDDITGLIGYYEPRGKHICELDDATSLKKNDCFLLTKANQPILSSNKCLYSTFEARSFEDIMDGISVRTMAWKDKYDYSLTSHLHDDLYSRVEWIPNARYQDSSNLTIGTMEIVTSCDIANKVIAKINVPVIDPPLPPEPMIGTFKFVSANAWAKMASTNGYSNTSQINPYDDSNNKIRDDFDGWVWANGSTIQNKSSQLSAASQVFANGSTTADFVVPDFSRFFKANPKTKSSFFDYSSNAYLADEPTVGIAKHHHTVSDLEIIATISFNKTETNLVNRQGYTNGNTQKKTIGPDGFHRGGGERTKVSVNATIDPSSLIFPNLLLSETGEESISESNQPYPKHNVIPVMVYIGGVTRKHFERASQN